MSIALVDIVHKRPLGINVLAFMDWIESTKSRSSSFYVFKPINFLPKFSAYDNAFTRFGNDLLVAEVDSKRKENTGLVLIDGESCEKKGRMSIEYVGNLQKQNKYFPDVDMIMGLLTNSAHRVYSRSPYGIFELDPETGIHTLLDTW